MKNKSIQPGDQVPPFTLTNQHGEQVDIEKYFDAPFVLYFYPKDDSPGCTAEACSFRDSYEDLRGLGAEVIGVSADSPESHLAFARKFDLPFVLLSDPGNDVRKKFGVPGSLFGLLPGRVTYVVGQGGTVQHVFNSQLNVREHVKVAIEELKEKP